MVIKIAKLLALMVLFFSLAHSSRATEGENQYEAFWVSKDNESEEKGLVVTVSAREVPTGPDPLHHNSVKPNRP